MTSTTSLVASNYRLQQWAQDIRDCNNRPSTMQVAEWCESHGISRNVYYYRLRKVREACLELSSDSPASFVEIPIRDNVIPACKGAQDTGKPTASGAVIHLNSGVDIDIRLSASSEFISNLIGALSNAK